MGELTPQAFAAKWRTSKAKERSGSHEHFMDICRLLGHPTPNEADPTGERFTFEKGAAKHAGGEGWADVWYRGHFAWEYKGKRANLSAAYDQLLQYREDLENPPLLITSDMDRFEVHCNFTGSAKRTYAFDLAGLAEGGPAQVVPKVEGLRPPAAIDVLRAAFFDPESLRPRETDDFVTRNVASGIANVADDLRMRGIDPHAAAHFLMKVIFCYFAEDVRLLPNKVFSRILDKTRDAPGLFVRYAGELFQAMASGGHVLLERIPCFDGGLFADSDVISLRPAEIDLLIRAGKWDWSDVDPSIFGTLFERCLDPDKHAQIGRHYTYADDIAAIVEPVLVAPLEEEWRRVAGRAEAMEAAGASPLELAGVLRAFQDRLAGVRVLDPACGSGNFLYVALWHLLALEKRVVNFAARRGVELAFRVRPTQMRGMEINRFAHELASVVIWIGYLQWMRNNGAPRPKEPILEPIETIHLTDAVLRRDGQTPTEPVWPEADFIVGNPPFLGGKKLRSELGDRYVDELFSVYAGRVPREADLCCYWFEKARAFIQAESRKRHRVRAGLLATQGIRGGANREVLKRIKESGDIFMAWSDRPWVLDGAAVRVSMVGFDDGAQEQRTLDGNPVPAINPDLSSRADIGKARRLRENLSIGFMGVTKQGPFDIDGELAREMLRQPNPHGKSNSLVVRPYFNGLDVTRRPRNMWLIDFGVMGQSEACLFEAPFEYVKEKVLPFRKARQRAWNRPEWWQLYAPRPEMRAALEGLSRYIATPTVAKHRLFVWLPPEVLPDHQLIVFARSDDYFFGVLQSRVHEVWSDAMGTQLREKESGRRYTPTTCFETFPFPWPADQAGPPEEKRQVHARISAAAARLDEVRTAWLNPEGVSGKELRRRTLTNLYNKRPTWLANAHAELDAAVLEAYGWPGDISQEEVVERLLELNRSRPPVTAG